MVTAQELFDENRLLQSSEGFSGVFDNRVSVAEVEKALREYLDRPVTCRVVASNSEAFALLCEITR